MNMLRKYRILQVRLKLARITNNEQYWENKWGRTRESTQEKINCANLVMEITKYQWRALTWRILASSQKLSLLTLKSGCQKWDSNWIKKIQKQSRDIYRGSRTHAGVRIPARGNLAQNRDFLKTAQQLGWYGTTMPCPENSKTSGNL